MSKKSKGNGMTAGMFWAGYSNCGHLGDLKPTIPAPKPQHLTDAQKQAESKINQAVRRG